MLGLAADSTRFILPVSCLIPAQLQCLVVPVDSATHLQRADAQVAKRWNRKADFSATAHGDKEEIGHRRSSCSSAAHIALPRWLVFTPDQLTFDESVRVFSREHGIRSGKCFRLANELGGGFFEVL